MEIEKGWASMSQGSKTVNTRGDEGQEVPSEKEPTINTLGQSPHNAVIYLYEGRFEIWLLQLRQATVHTQLIIAI